MTVPPSSRALCIVVPVLNEGTALASAVQALAPLRQRGASVVLVDGGSTDGSIALVRPWVDTVVAAPRGRASQMNAGARACMAEVYLFLHADTRLPPDADTLIAQALCFGRTWGRFDVRFDSPRWAMRLVSWAMNLRSAWSGIATGDQAIFVQREAFAAVGGFPCIALMEDIALSTGLKAVSRPARIAQPVTTSARRWRAQGVVRTVLLMWRLRLAYFLGVEPAQLALRYGYHPVRSAVCAVTVMAKAPVPGLAKTRLIPALGAHGAARLQRAFTLGTLRVARQAGLVPTLWCAPGMQHRFFRAVAQRCGVALQAQPEGNIGARMHAAVQHHFAQVGADTAAPAVLVVGTDCPALSAAHLHHAASVLADHDAVLIPAQDGGYVLIGLRLPHAAVFEGVDWSTPQVLAQTRERLRGAGLSWAELDTLWDVDTPDDLLRLKGIACNR